MTKTNAKTLFDNRIASSPKTDTQTQTKIVLTIRVVLTLENHNIISYGKKVNFTNTDFTENQRYSFYVNWNLQRQSSPGANCPHKFRTRFTGCCYCCHWYSVIEPFWIVEKSMSIGTIMKTKFALSKVMCPHFWSWS